MRERFRREFGEPVDIDPRGAVCTHLLRPALWCADSAQESELSPKRVTRHRSFP